MQIKILGSGCPNCRRLEKFTRQAVEEMGVPATITKVTDMSGILAYDILGTPALVIDEQVVSSGRVLRKAEVASLLANALSDTEA
jgi:small redox-active disulfide protein 2